MITFVILVVSAYRQYRASSEAALLSDVTSSIATHLVLEELVYVDSVGKPSAYVIDPVKLGSLTKFKRGVGGENYGFRVSLSYRSGMEHVLGPYGTAPPADRPNCTLVVGAALFENNRLLPAKFEVVAWRA